MIDRIKSITSEGLVKFTDQRSGKETFSSKVNCEAYGYKYVNGKCYAFRDKDNTLLGSKIGTNNTERGNNNIARGVNNEINGYGNHIYGNHNLVNGIDNTILGNNIYADNNNVIALGSSATSNRSRVAIVLYSGFTNDAITTELFIGGIGDQRFKMNDDFDTCYSIDYTAIAMETNNGYAWSEYGHYTAKYISGTLTEIGHQTGHTVRDSSADYDVAFKVYNSPYSYLDVSVEGEANHDVYWSVKLIVTEVRV